jgi:hypothetical protein
VCWRDAYDVVEDGLVSPVGIEQGLEPFGAGATAGGEFLGQQPVGFGPGGLGGLDFLEGGLGGLGRLDRLGGFSRLDRHSGLDRLDRLNRLGGGGDGIGLGGHGFLFQRERGAHGLRGLWMESG